MPGVRLVLDDVVDELLARPERAIAAAFLAAAVLAVVGRVAGRGLS